MLPHHMSKSEYNLKIKNMTLEHKEIQGLQDRLNFNLLLKNCHPLNLLDCRHIFSCYYMLLSLEISLM